jgi:hypothetical protein
MYSQHGSVEDRNDWWIGTRFFEWINNRLGLYVVSRRAPETSDTTRLLRHDTVARFVWAATILFLLF